MLSTIFFILFNNLLSIHIHKCVEKFGGLSLPPLKPLMSAAYALRYAVNFTFDPEPF